MNPLLILHKDKIDSIVYDKVYLEKPMSNLIDFDWKNILKPPALNSSKETLKELSVVSAATKNRTSKDIELVHNVDSDMDTPYVLLLKKYNLKYPQNYIDLFYDIVRPVLLNLKSYYNRARPNQLALYLKVPLDVIVTDTHHTASYPSGHVVYTNLVANILKDIYPQIPKKELDYIVNETSRARILQGVHFPSDNNASIILSNYLFEKLQPKLRKYYNDTI
jgi:hypothetical protein